MLIQSERHSLTHYYFPEPPAHALVQVQRDLTICSGGTQGPWTISPSCCGIGCAGPALEDLTGVINLSATLFRRKRSVRHVRSCTCSSNEMYRIRSFEVGFGKATPGSLRSNSPSWRREFPRGAEQGQGSRCQRSKCVSPLFSFVIGGQES